MQPAFGGADKGCGGLDRLDRAALVVGVMQGHEGPARPRQCCLQPVQVDHAVAVHRQHLDRAAAYGGGLGDAGVFGGGHDDPLTAGRQGAGQTLGVGLGPPGREDHRRRVGPDQRRHLGPGGLDSRSGAPAEGVDSVGVAALVDRVEHRGPHLGAHQGSGIVIQIDFHAAASAVRSGDAGARRVRRSITSSSETLDR